MAISFQNNLFSNSFANAFDNLKPRITKGRDNGEKIENDDAKTGTQDANVTINNQSKQSIYNIRTNEYSTSNAVQKSDSQSAKDSTNVSALLSNLKNILTSSLDMFVGIPKENQNNPAIADWLKNQNALTINASYEQFNAQWVGKKLDNSSLFFGSLNATSASFKFEA